MDVCAVIRDLENQVSKIAVVGLGYVGLPLAQAFSKKYHVIGYDRNEAKISSYQNGIDVTGEVGDDALKRSPIQFTSCESDLAEARYYVIAVPTPVDENHVPEHAMIQGASESVGRHLKRGDCVVYESTVYPGMTEEIAIPILEAYSHLQAGSDFFVGYSPERISPGDKHHRLETIVKVVSGLDQPSLTLISHLYASIIEAGIYQAESIRVAEACKVVENSQRDINIAFMNELAITLDHLGINTRSVLKAASTKWNFLNFYPGLVGGHCIGVDPYYLIHKAEEEGLSMNVLKSGRRLNDSMSSYVLSKIMEASYTVSHDIHIAFLGVTFKENVPDCRNSKVFDIIHGLQQQPDFRISVVDPYADEAAVYRECGLPLTTLETLEGQLDILVFAVGHDCFKTLPQETIEGLFAEQKVIFDIMNIHPHLQRIPEYRYLTL